MDKMRATLVRQISELRAALGDSEARRAELEAVIEKLKRLEELSSTPDWPGWNALNSVWDIIQDAPSSVVLEDRDREVAARAVEAMADEGERFMFGATGERMPANMDVEGIAPRWHEVRRLRERAAAIREGDTNA